MYNVNSPSVGANIQNKTCSKPQFKLTTTNKQFG
jgi:hypothetical protein